MGTTIRSLSEAVSYIASDNTWIEGKAIQQLQTTAALPHMQRVVGMPDLHPGRGYPIGAAFFSTHVFILLWWGMILVVVWRYGKPIFR